jgi:hypothetical protein
VVRHLGCHTFDASSYLSQSKEIRWHVGSKHSPQAQAPAIRGPSGWMEVRGSEAVVIQFERS